MKKFIFRAGLVSSTMSVALLALPAQSHAFGFQWLKNMFGCGSCCGTTQAAYYGGMCDPCGPRTVQYVPTTAYRMQYVNVPTTTYRPVVTYQPVTAVNPCTGCASTSYRPVTAMQPVTCCSRQARMVPYSTYRLVYSNPAPAVQTVAMSPTACGCSTGGATTTYYAPQASVSTTTSSATSTMPATTTYYPPSGTTSYPTTTTQVIQQPATQVIQQPATQVIQQPATQTYLYQQQPADSQNNGSSSQSNGDTSGAATESHLKPIPDTNADSGVQLNSTSAPQLINPDDKTTSLPAHSYSNVAWRSSTVEQATYNPATEANTDGWRTSSR